MLRTMIAHIRRASWESRVAVAIPLLLALLALPVMLGAFAAGQPPTTGSPGGGYGPPPSTPKPTITLPVTTRPHPCNPRSRFC